MLPSLCADHNKKYHYYSINSNTLKCNECKEIGNESDLIPINTIVEKKISEIEKLEKRLNYVKHNSLLRESTNFSEDELKMLFESVLCSQDILRQGQEEMMNFLKTCGIQLAKDIIAAKSLTSKEIVNRLSDDIMIIKENLKNVINIQDYKSFLSSLNDLSLVTYNCEETMKHFKLIESIFQDKEISSDSLLQFFTKLNAKVKSVIEKALENIEFNNFLKISKNNIPKNKLKKEEISKNTIQADLEEDKNQKETSRKKFEKSEKGKDNLPEKSIDSIEIKKKRKNHATRSDKSDNEEIVEEVKAATATKECKNNEKRGRGRPRKEIKDKIQEILSYENEKRGRGRPRKETTNKNQEILSNENEKRGRGRPRKETTNGNQEIFSIENEDEQIDENKVDKASGNLGNENKNKDKESQLKNKKQLDKNQQEVYNSMKKKKLILSMKQNLDENKESGSPEKKDGNDDFEKLERIGFNSIANSEAQKAIDHKLSESITKIINSSEPDKQMKMFQLLKEDLNVYKLIFSTGKKFSKCPFLLQILKKISKVQKISFEEIQLKESCMETLFGILESIDVSKIEFENCKIASVKNIVTSLDKSRILHLTFKSCKFESEVPIFKSELVSLIKESKTLLSLKIKSCKITDEFSEGIAQGISENSFLKVLDLSGNLFTSEGLLKIFSGFEKNNSIEKIVMKLNNIDFESTKDKLEDLVRNRPIDLKLISD